MPWRRDRRGEVKDPESYERLPQHDAERLGKLFDSLDKQGNGRITVQDIMYKFNHISEEQIKVMSWSGNPTPAFFPGTLVCLGVHKNG